MCYSVIYMYLIIVAPKMLCLITSKKWFFSLVSPSLPPSTYCYFLDFDLGNLRNISLNLILKFSFFILKIRAFWISKLILDIVKTQLMCAVCFAKIRAHVGGMRILHQYNCSGSKLTKMHVCKVWYHAREVTPVTSLAWCKENKMWYLKT